MEVYLPATLFRLNDTEPVFGYEKDWNMKKEDDFYHWITQNWTQSLIYAGLYVVAVFGGRYYMEDKPRYDLRIPLVLWSGVLALFSILGAVRTIPEMYFVITKYGLKESVCSRSYFFHPVSSFWSVMFTVSKAYELGDTLFIVLRKQQLIFLHWYHHITVMIYVWYSYTDRNAAGRWFMVMNYIVHAFMYSYYALRAARFKIPKPVQMVITTLQISQMFIGTIVIMWVYQIRARNEPCDVTWECVNAGFLMYFSYFILFLQFFCNAYIYPTQSPIPDMNSNMKASLAKKAQ